MGKMRRPFALLFALVFGLLVLGCSETAEPTSPWVNKVSPKFSFRPLAPGGDITSESLRGKVVLLDFWATWCGPCLQIMPLVSELSKKHKDAGLVVIGVSTEPSTTVAQFRDTRLDPGYELVTDPNGKASMVYGVTSLPTTILIGRDGKIRHYEVGADPDGGISDLEEAVVKALSEKA
jgi:thiol-disulfide isomerase/thioredoxin